MLPKLKLAKYTILLAIAFSAVIVRQPAIPAERIDFNYSLLGFKIEVEDLEAFAKRGEISNSLNFYLKRIPSKQTELQKFLSQSYDVDPVLVYRYSRTSVGIKLLERIGEIIQLPGNLNGFYGLRAAVVQAAESEGINFIEFLKRFPTNIQLNLKKLLELVKQISNAEADTKEFIASLPQNNAGKSEFENVADLSQPGAYPTVKQTLEFYDRSRQRSLVTDLYLPQGKTDTIATIAISNGLGAKRDRFAQLANYLASYGFVVVVPDHPGSDRQRQKAFLQGLYRENFDATDFSDRPRDISFILDELERLNPTSFDNKLDLERVGIFGYSIGGTTALSLAGAEFDFKRLERECAKPLNLLNISTLYQCRALELPRSKRSLKDERIQAVFAFVPFGNSLFNPQQLKEISLPIMFQVVDRDFLTSLLEEQIPLFEALGNDSYLVISEKLPHSNVTLSKEQQSSQAKTFEVAKKYQNILSLVFFQNYVANNQKYQPYLGSEYIQAIEQEPYKLHLIERKALQ